MTRKVRASAEGSDDQGGQQRARKIGENRCHIIIFLDRHSRRGYRALTPRPLRPIADGLLYHALNRDDNRAAT
jgi:hypothetical protein